MKAQSFTLTSLTVLTVLVGCAPKSSNSAATAADSSLAPTGSVMAPKGNLARSGKMSFGGIQVLVTIDPSKGEFKIGESDFEASVVATKAGRAMSASRRVGIGTEDETLTATIYIDGGNGGDPAEYNCENSRIKITRLSDEGQTTEVKNECAYLEAAAN